MVHSIAADLEIVLMKMVLLLEEILKTTWAFFEIPVNLINLPYPPGDFTGFLNHQHCIFGKPHCLGSSKPTPSSRDNVLLEVPPRMVRGKKGWADAIPEDNLTGQTGEEWWETRMVDSL